MLDGVHQGTLNVFNCWKTFKKDQASAYEREDDSDWGEEIPSVIASEEGENTRNFSDPSAHQSSDASSEGSRFDGSDDGESDAGSTRSSVSFNLSRSTADTKSETGSSGGGFRLTESPSADDNADKKDETRPIEGGRENGGVPTRVPVGPLMPSGEEGQCKPVHLDCWNQYSCHYNCMVPVFIAIHEVTGLPTGSEVTDQATTYFSVIADVAAGMHKVLGKRLKVSPVA